jgi:hypothetical protein
VLFGVAVIGGGFLVGLVVGRWWALAAPVALGIYVYFTAEASRYGHSDIPWAAVALAYGVWAAVGVVGGLLARHLARRRAKLF